MRDKAPAIYLDTFPPNLCKLLFMQTALGRHFVLYKGGGGGGDGYLMGLMVGETEDCCSVTKSYPTLCNPMDCSTPGFPVS